MKTNLILFTSTTCPKCPAAKDLLDSKGLEYELMEIPTNPEAIELAKEHGIMHVPAILIDNQVFSIEEFKSAF